MKETYADKMNAMRQEATKELLKSFIPLLNGPFDKVTQNVLNEVLVENKTFKELKESIPYLPAMRHDPVFRSGVSRLCKTVPRLMEVEAEYKKVKAELEDLRKKFGVVETKRTNRAMLSPEQQEALALTLEQAGFSSRIKNSFEGANIVTIADVVTFSRKDILKFRNTGQKSVDEVEAFLKSKGLKWGMDV